jgi:uncharacterized protein (DUF1684 family)
LPHHGGAKWYPFRPNWRRSATFEPYPEERLACVFSEHAICPLPPPQNRFAFRVEAGEKRYGVKAV